MAITTHPQFRQPADPTEKVRRYIDLARYISFIKSFEIFLCRIDRFDDPFEGSLTVPSFGALSQFSASMFAAGHAETHDHVQSQFLHAFKQSRSNSFASCWHLGNFESEAMWKIYAPHTLGVCVSLEYAALASALPNDLYIGLVNYADYDSDYIDTNNLFSPIMTKRRAFEHEREVRIVHVDMQWGSSSVEGRTAAIEIGSRLEVHTHPYAPSWYFDVVKDVTARYTDKIEVMRSKLSNRPLL